MLQFKQSSNQNSNVCPFLYIDYRSYKIYYFYDTALQHWTSMNRCIFEIGVLSSLHMIRVQMLLWEGIYMQKNVRIIRNYKSRQKNL